MPIAFEELDGSPRIRQSRSEYSATRMFKVAWTDASAFLAKLWGGWTYTPSGPIRIPPAYFPGFPWMIVDDVQTDPWGAATSQTLTDVTSGFNSFGYAKITVTYKPQQFGQGNQNPPNTPTVPDGTFLEVTSEETEEFMTVPGRKLKWSAGPQDPLEDDAPVAIALGSVLYTMNWTRVPTPPWSDFTAMAGKVNNADFLDWPAGKVRFLGQQIKRKFQANGDPMWDCGLRFKARSQPWNYVYRKSSSAFEAVVRDDGSPPYASANFSTLFAFGS